MTKTDLVTKNVLTIEAYDRLSKQVVVDHKGPRPRRSHERRAGAPRTPLTPGPASETTRLTEHQAHSDEPHPTPPLGAVVAGRSGSTPRQRAAGQRPAAQSSAPRAEEPMPRPDQYSAKGADTCLDCHDDESATYSAGRSSSQARPARRRALALRRQRPAMRGLPWPRRAASRNEKASAINTFKPDSKVGSMRATRPAWPATRAIRARAGMPAPTSATTWPAPTATSPPASATR